MSLERIDADRSNNSGKIFNDLTETTTSYTYHSPSSLLSATLLAQTALTLMQKSPFEDVRSRRLIQGAAPAKVMPTQSFLSVTLYRGLTMPVAIERNTEGRSNYSMIAVNPSRTS